MTGTYHNIQNAHAKSELRLTVSKAKSRVDSRGYINMERSQNTCHMSVSASMHITHFSRQNYAVGVTTMGDKAPCAKDTIITPRHQVHEWVLQPPVTKRARQRTRLPEQINWLHTFPEQIPLMKKRKKVLDRTEPRVTLWNPTEQRKLSGNAAPSESNLISYLVRHPVSLLE